MRAREEEVKPETHQEFHLRLRQQLEKTDARTVERGLRETPQCRRGQREWFSLVVLAKRLLTSHAHRIVHC
jgi:hypothetical protein